MTELTEFFLLLVALYLAECLIKAPRGTTGFIPWFWSGWRIWKGSDFYGNPRWGMFMGNPAPGLGGAALSELWPVSLSPEGAFSYVSQAYVPIQRHEQSAVFHRFEDIQKVAWDDCAVLVNGEAFVKVASPVLARQLAKLIQDLARMPAEKRAARIDLALRAGLDLAAVRARWEEYEKATSWLATWSEMLFGVFFLVAPAAAWIYGLGTTWPMLLLAMVLLLALNVFSFARAHRRLYPDLTMDRWLHLMIMVPLPVAAIRGPAFLLRNLLAEFHPLAMARAFCKEERFLELARGLVRDTEYPIAPVCPTQDAGPVETERYFRERLRAAVGEFLAGEGFVMETLAGPPEREGDDHVAYCPRCHCQFIIAEGQCETCNLPLKTFDLQTTQS